MNVPDRDEPNRRQSGRVQALLAKADGHYRQGHRLRAIWYYKMALRLEPDNVIGLVNLGLIYSTCRGKMATALQMLERAGELDQQNPTILFNLATLTAQMGNPAKALGFLEKAEEFSSDYPDLHYNKAYLYAQQEQWEDAAGEIEKELAANPGNMNARMMQNAIVQRLSSSPPVEEVER